MIVLQPKWHLALFLMLMLFPASNGQGQNALQKGSLPTDGIQEKSIGEKVSDVGKSILVIFQDSQGRHWFGSKDTGAYRYDGKSLIRFSRKDGLCSDSILNILEDREGRIYFDTTEGVNQFDGRSIKTLKVVQDKLSTPEWKRETDDLWFRCGWNHPGPFRYDGKALYALSFPQDDRADAFRKKFPNVQHSPFGIYSIYRDRRGDLWFGTAALGVCRFDGKTLQWLDEKHLSQTPNGGAFGIRSILEDREGSFWFCNALFRFDLVKDKPAARKPGPLKYRRKLGAEKTVGSDAAIKDLYFMSMIEDAKGNHWMATYDDGVWRRDGSKLIHYPVRHNNQNVLLLSMVCDAKGKIWLGTKFQGVFHLENGRFKKVEWTGATK